jgi:hypothetical protein
MKLKGSFVPPAGEDLNQDIEKKLGEFLQTIGAGQLFQSKLGTSPSLPPFAYL